MRAQFCSGLTLGSAHKLVHIRFEKCPMIWGLLQVDTVKQFMNDSLIMGDFVRSEVDLTPLFMLGQKQT